MTSETVQAAQRLLEDLYAAASRGFHATASSGVDSSYRRISRFESLVDLHAFERAWTAAMLAVRDALEAAQPDPDRAAYLARWANAPARATHLAQGPIGVCWWFYSKPMLVDGTWYCNGVWSNAGHNLLGRVDCEARPEPAQQPDRESYIKRWKKAPSWANWLSENIGRWCHWSADAPVLNGSNWRFSGANQTAGKGMLGRVACEPRPVQGVEP